MNEPRAVVGTFMDALGRYDTKTMGDCLHEGYIQHNPHAPTGSAFILGLGPTLQEAGFAFDVHRTIQDGQLVLTHATYRNAQVLGAETVVVFDIWRVAGEKIVEHWDCIEPLASDPVGGRTQTDGPTEVIDRNKTEANKRLVETFVTSVLINENWEEFQSFLRDGIYKQHNPAFEDGQEGLEGARQIARIHKIHRVIGEGNFVLTQSEGEVKAKTYAFYDLFRVDDGKLVEHWDVLQEIPAEMAHENGMF
ncbi:MAG: nuclear transport factor 2 family protein [Myxococcota bacterium]